jgi:hypothetical protein
MQSSSHKTTTTDCLSLEQQHDHWTLFGERKAMQDWIDSWNPNLFISLVPQDHRFSAEHVQAIATRWCRTVQENCFTRNWKSHIGKFAMFVEHDEKVGWHAHGVGCMPDHHLDLIHDQASRYLRKITNRYIDYLPLAGKPLWRNRIASADVSRIPDDCDPRDIIAYCIKRWQPNTKGQHLVLSGRESHWA